MYTFELSSVSPFESRYLQHIINLHLEEESRERAGREQAESRERAGRRVREMRRLTR